jgi:hypothetical protein
LTQLAQVLVLLQGKVQVLALAQIWSASLACKKPPIFERITSRKLYLIKMTI